MEETLSFDFCTITLHENFVVVVMKEGVNITPDYQDVFIEVTETYYANKSFVYITNRIHSYSVDPKVYREIEKIKNLKGLAVVSKNYQAKLNAQIERMFFNKPFEIFTNISDAYKWADNIIKPKI